MFDLSLRTVNRQARGFIGLAGLPVTIMLTASLSVTPILQAQSGTSPNKSAADAWLAPDKSTTPAKPQAEPQTGKHQPEKTQPAAPAPTPPPLEGLSEGVNKLQVYQTRVLAGGGQSYVLGESQIQIKPGDGNVEQTFEITVFWSVKLIAVDKETSKPIETAFTYVTPITTAEMDSKARTERYEQIEKLLATNESYGARLIRKLTDVDGTEFSFGVEEVFLPVYAAGYRMSEAHVKQSDPRPRVYTVKLEKLEKPQK